MNALRFSTVLSSKGQVVIPKAARKTLGLREGDRLEVNVDPEGKQVILRPKRLGSWRDLRGAFGPVVQTTSEILAEGRREEFQKERRL